MTPVLTETATNETFRYFGPLDVKFETQGYPHFPPSAHWAAPDSEAKRIETTNRDVTAVAANELATLPLRLFISGMQVLSGASASLQPERLIGVVRGQMDFGDFTILELDADDPPVGERMRGITGARALVESRLNALSSLPAGWLDGEGVTPAPAAVAAARHLIWILLNHGIERPRLAPTPEGGVEAEWSQGDREVSVTFEPDGGLYGNAVDVNTGKIWEPPLRPEDHRAVADFVLGA